MENKYYLAIETKPKNYFPIDLKNLNISKGFTSFNLAELDSFTLQFTKKEIIDSIKEANLLEIDDNMSLVIIYSEKNMVRKTEVLTKEIRFDLWQDINNHFENKLYLNKIYNFLSKKISEEQLTKIKQANSIHTFLKEINNLSYDIQRKLYFYLYEKQL